MNVGTVGNIPIIDKSLDATGWYYCPETNERYYHDGKSLRDTIPVTTLWGNDRKLDQIQR